MRYTMVMEREDIPKAVVSGLLFLFLVFLAVQIIHFSGRAKAARVGYDAAERAHGERLAERDRLQAELDFYANPENFMKELRARFNYRVQGEKTLILVPQQQQ